MGTAGRTAVGSVLPQTIHKREPPAQRLLEGWHHVPDKLLSLTGKTGPLICAVLIEQCLKPISLTCHIFLLFIFV